jgi:hypothetical protein
MSTGRVKVVGLKRFGFSLSNRARGLLGLEHLRGIPVSVSLLKFVGSKSTRLLASHDPMEDPFVN